jgi:hypothetical protein
VIIVDSNAVQSHPTVVVIANTTLVTDRAMMHSRELINLAFLAKPPSSEPSLLLWTDCCPHEIFWQVVILEY